MWRTWTVPDVPGVCEMLIEVETWPLTLKTGEIDVYANPTGECRRRVGRAATYPHTGTIIVERQSAE
ncbi:MAG: hypothetical protein HY870_24245 [Chloroflexi bacterium]|nr:hypothetical protein [Chloroflexota bacterium]